MRAGQSLPDRGPRHKTRARISAPPTNCNAAQPWQSARDGNAMAIRQNALAKGLISAWRANTGETAVATEPANRAPKKPKMVPWRYRIIGLTGCAIGDTGFERCTRPLIGSLQYDNTRQPGERLECPTVQSDAAVFQPGRTGGR